MIGALLALPPIVALRGFTVDDAWIPARYAAHLASGAGYRFNPGGPPTDGVTPLPWAPLLALLGGHAGIEAAWWSGRALGLLAWLLAAGLLASSVARLGGSPWRFVALLPLTCSAPLAAWSVAGLETGLATLLATLAVTAGGSLAAATAAGLAATLRPEMIVLAAAIAAWRAASVPVLRRVAVVALALGPWMLVVALRLFFFGKPYPLSAAAKPSDLTHGFAYVAAGLLFGGAPLLALALPRAEGSGSSQAEGGEAPAWQARGALLAAVAHALAVLWAGGDWMPLSRLLVPSIPAWMVVAAHVGARSGRWASLLRATLAVATMAVLWWRVGVAASEVSGKRAALIERARPVLAAYRTVACLDVGWVGATTAARVVDLAGLTDPAIAVLPGGHTSKRVTGAMLADRGVEALLLLRRRGCEGACVREDGGPFDRAVEERLRADPWVSDRFEPAGTIEAGGLTYVLLVARP